MPFRQGILFGMCTLLAAGASAQVVVNELMASNSRTIADEAGQFDDWIELYNAGNSDVNLGGMYLTDDPNLRSRWWRIPAGTTIGPRGFLLFWADDETAQGPLHTSFRLSATEGDRVSLIDRDANGNRLLDDVVFGPLGTDISYGRLVDGGPELGELPFASPSRSNHLIATATPTPPPVNLPVRINELLASNTTTLQDEAGEYDDWFELYNAGNEAIDLGGMYLTDNAALPRQWQIPAGTVIPEGGFLLFWADNDPADGPLHTNFQLDATNGETLLLIGRDDQALGLVDRVNFGPQAPNVSYGRLGDAAPFFVFFQTPSPRASNGTLPGATPDADLDGNGRVNHEDLLRFVRQWHRP